MESKGGIGLPTILFIVFVTLKLTGNIDWSWWWVASPIWIPIAAIAVIGMAVSIILAAMLMAGYTLDHAIKKLNPKKEENNQTK